MTTSSEHISLADVRWREVAPGVERGELRSTEAGGGATVLRFAAGSSSGDHIHPGGEDLFVLSGRLRLGGAVLEAGDYHYTPPGGVNDAEAYEDTIVFLTQPLPAEFL